MAAEDSKVTFFNIEACGYYTFGPRPTREFGDTMSILRDLQAWSSGLRLEQTKLMGAGGAEGQMPVYLLDIVSVNNEWLLTMWNQTPATDNAVASVMGNGNVGSATVVMNDVAAGSIPGFATYFWFVPARDVFANVRFQHLVGGHLGLRNYLRAFVERHSSHVVEVPAAAVPAGSGPRMDIAGYRASVNDATRTDVAPRFSSSVFVKPGDRDFLRTNVRNVTKITRRTTLELQTTEDVALWQSLRRKLHLAPNPAPLDCVNIEYEVKTTVSTDEVTEIIDSWDNEVDKSTWDDYGFTLKGQAGQHWLSKSYARDNVILEVTRTNAELVGSMALLEELQRRRQALLSLLD